MGSNPTLSAMLNRRKEAKHSLHNSQNEGRAAAKWRSDWTTGPCRKVQTIVVCWLVEEGDGRMSHLWLECDQRSGIAIELAAGVVLWARKVS